MLFAARLLLTFLGCAIAVLARANGGGLPEFVENKAQWPGEVAFRADIPGGVFWAEQQSFLFTLAGDGWSSIGHPSPNDTEAAEDYRLHHYRLSFEGSSIPAIAGEEEKPHRFNYFIGNNQSRWASGVKPFKRIRYSALYPGIDLLVYGKNNNIKYDFVVAPGADPTAIVQRYDGADGLALVSGKLVVYTSIREVVELEPYAYQLINGQLVDVACAFVLNENRVHFELGAYDPAYPLVIDPEISFSTFIGATSSNFGFTATDDEDGNLISGGVVFGPGYPLTLGAAQDSFSTITNGNCDAVISKFSDDGSLLLYSTFFGGNAIEMPHSVVCDSDGNYVVMGTTGSTNFPVTDGVFQPTLAGGPLFGFGSFFIQAANPNGTDLFVAKFNADDSGLIASTYIGGSNTDGLNMGDKLFYNYGDTFRGEVSVDADDNILVATTTLSADFPMAGGGPQQTIGGQHDGVVFRLSPDLSTLLWSTYIGGSSNDAAYSVQVNSAGAVVVSGGTWSTNLPMAPGAYQANNAGDVDAYVIRYALDGQSIAASTYFGSNQYDQAFFVQMDLNDNIYLLGQTDGNLGVSPGVYGNPNSGQFIVKFTPNLQTQLWRTTVGTGSGEVDISPTAFLVSDCDQIYFSGWGGLTNSLQAPYATQSTTFGLPTTADAYQSNTDGSDFYLCVLNPDAVDLAYATFFGGGTSREHVDGGSSKFDKDGSVYQAVCAGCGGFSDFPTTPGAWSNTNNSSNCNIGVFKFDLAILDAAIAVSTPQTVCVNESAQFFNESVGADTYEWDFGDGVTSNEMNPEHAFSQPGIYAVSLYASHSLECNTPDFTFVTIEVLPGPDIEVDAVPLICEGESIELNASSDLPVTWNPDPTLSSASVENPIATPVNPVTEYTVSAENECGSSEAIVVVQWEPSPVVVPADPLICIGQSTTIALSGALNYDWSPTTGLTFTQPNGAAVIAAPTATTTYTIEATSALGCVHVHELTVTVEVNTPGGQVYPTVFACTGENTVLEASNGFAWSWQPAELVSDPGAQLPVVNLTNDTWFSVEVWNICGTGIDSVFVDVIVPVAFAGDDAVMCRGDHQNVWAAGGESYFWTPQAFVSNPTAAETSVSPYDDQVFTVYVTDEYGCTATAEVAINVLPLPYVNAGPDRVLDWLESDYLFGSSDGVESWWEPETYLNCADCLTAITTPEQSMWYTLYTIDANGCRNLDSVYVDVFNPVYVPNTFTPNNDGINDVFRVEGIDLRGFRLEVHNRWGELVFSTDDPNRFWDGSVQGGEHYVQIDTYVWTVWFDSKDGRQKRTGHVNVVR